MCHLFCLWPFVPVQGIWSLSQVQFLLPPAVIVLPVWSCSAWIKILFPLEICSQVIWFRDCGHSKQVMVQSHITSWSASWSVVFCTCFLKTVTTFSLPHSCQQKHPLHTHTHRHTTTTIDSFCQEGPRASFPNWITFAHRSSKVTCLCPRCNLISMYF